MDYTQHGMTVRGEPVVQDQDGQWWCLQHPLLESPELQDYVKADLNSGDEQISIERAAEYCAVGTVYPGTSPDLDAHIEAYLDSLTTTEN